MVGINDLKRYDCENIEDYFDLIVESAVNGQFKQVKMQISDMSLGQKGMLLEWCMNYVYFITDKEDSMRKHYEYVHRLTIETLK